MKECAWCGITMRLVRVLTLRDHCRECAKAKGLLLGFTTLPLYKSLVGFKEHR